MCRTASGMPLILPYPITEMISSYSKPPSPKGSTMEDSHPPGMKACVTSGGEDQVAAAPLRDLSVRYVIIPLLSS